ncbi:MAG: hypothetical protein GXP29_11215, partial [Planctomycetes bacterium]|nr:hypothetical protein [Planctomycetota bacterium]
ISDTIVQRVFESKGIQLTSKQANEVKTALLASKGHSFHLDLDVSGPDQSVTITDDDVRNASDTFACELQEFIEPLIIESIRKIGPEILESSRKDVKEAIAESHETSEQVRAGLRKQWAPALDRLAALVGISREALETLLQDQQATVISESRNDSEESGGDDTGDEPGLWDAIIAIHARACRTAAEIVTLLSSGYVDGALARWRSLHELTVVAMFLVQQRGDIAERYLRHEAVQRSRQAREYQRWHVQLGFSAVPEAEMKEVQADYDEVIADYGDEFRHDYGWAAHELRKKKPTFRDLEDSIDLSHWRPYYKSACDVIHASPASLFVAPKNGVEGTLYIIADAFNEGLAYPVIFTARSLLLVTSCLVAVDPTMDNLVTCEVMRLIGEELEEVAHEIEEQVAKESQLSSANNRAE